MGLCTGLILLANFIIKHNDNYKVYTLTLALPAVCTVTFSSADTSGHSSPSPDLAQLANLQSKAAHFLAQGLAPSTMATYSTGKKRYIHFCDKLLISPIPSSESTLLLFVSHLGVESISHATIKVYLSAIGHTHVVAGLHDVFNKQLTPSLQLVFCSIKKSQALITLPRAWLPITIQIMQSIQQILSNQPNSYRNIMLWAVCCLAFFGFLLVSEFTIPSQDAYDPSVHLSLQDISINSRDNLSL